MYVVATSFFLRRFDVVTVHSKPCEEARIEEQEFYRWVSNFYQIEEEKEESVDEFLSATI